MSQRISQMTKYLISLFSLSFFITGCANNTPSYPVNKIPPKQTAVTEKLPVKKHKTFKNDRHPDFNYDQLGYHSQDGAYFGYFDRNGFYCDGIYYPYDNDLTYEDRLHRSGYFAPTVKHFPVYHEDDGGGYYYYVPSRYYLKKRPHHPVHYEERHLGSGSYRGLTYEEKQK